MPNNDPLEEDAHFIDVSWNTDDERLDIAVEDIFENTEFETPKKRKDAVVNLKKHLRAVLIVCIRAYQLNPDTTILCPFSNNFGKDAYRGDYDPYNPMNYKFNKIREVIRSLNSQGCLELNVGRQDYFTGGFEQRATRFKPTQALKEYIERKELDKIEFKMELINEGMRITYKNERGFRRILYDYNDIEIPDDVADSKEWLPNYNKLIEETDVRLCHQVSNQIINFNNKSSYRVFHEKRYDYGGRFYGGWWTYCSREDRRYIAINNEQTVECDYRSNHLYLYYGLNDTEMPEELRDDPYSISDEYPREIFKLFITRSFNCDGPYGIIKHISTMFFHKNREDMKDLELLREYKITNALEMRKVMDLIYSKHPILRNSTDADQGHVLMNYDSKVAAFILKKLTNLNIPVLSIHDSFIVQRSHLETLKQVMEEAYDYLSIPWAKPPITEKYALITRNENNIMEETGAVINRLTTQEFDELTTRNRIIRTEEEREHI